MCTSCGVPDRESAGGGGGGGGGVARALTVDCVCGKSLT